MSRTKVTAEELYVRIIREIGDPGGLDIIVLHSNDGGWLAKVYRGQIPLPESGFQVALDEIVAKLRLQYDLCLYSAIPPMTPESMRNKLRAMPPDHPERDRLWRHWKEKGVTAVAPIFQINADFYRAGR